MCVREDKAWFTLHQLTSTRLKHLSSLFAGALS